MKASVNPQALARRQFLEISASPQSAEHYIALLRLGASAFPAAAGTLDLAADRIEGIAAKTGPAGVDDSAALRRIADLSAQGRGREAVGIVAASMAPHDPVARATIARRLRKKRDAMEMNRSG